MPIDMSQAVKAPPRKSTPGRSNARQAAAVQPATQSLNEARRQGLMGLAQLGQGVALLFGQYADAAAIGQFFPPVAAELANVADGNDTFAKPIDILIEVGPYGGLIAAVLPFGLQIAANHGWVKAETLAGQGVVPPQVLESQMKARMAQMQAEALRQQRDAIRQAQEAQREFDAMLEDEMRQNGQTV
jgi:hypothetical protein